MCEFVKTALYCTVVLYKYPKIPPIQTTACLLWLNANNFKMYNTMVTCIVICTSRYCRKKCIQTRTCRRSRLISKALRGWLDSKNNC